MIRNFWWWKYIILKNILHHRRNKRRQPTTRGVVCVERYLKKRRPNGAEVCSECNVFRGIEKFLTLKNRPFFKTLPTNDEKRVFKKPLHRTPVNEENDGIVSVLANVARRHWRPVHWVVGRSVSVTCFLERTRWPYALEKKPLLLFPLLPPSNRAGWTRFKNIFKKHNRPPLVHSHTLVIHFCYSNDWLLSHIHNSHRVNPPLSRLTTVLLRYVNTQRSCSYTYNNNVVAATIHRGMSKVVVMSTRVFQWYTYTITVTLV